MSKDYTVAGIDNDSRDTDKYYPRHWEKSGGKAAWTYIQPALWGRGASPHRLPKGAIRFPAPPSRRRGGSAFQGSRAENFLVRRRLSPQAHLSPPRTPYSIPYQRSTDDRDNNNSGRTRTADHPGALPLERTHTHTHTDHARFSLVSCSGILLGVQARQQHLSFLSAFEYRHPQEGTSGTAERVPLSTTSRTSYE